MSDDRTALMAQARAARIMHDRKHLVAIIEMCLREIRTKDHLLGQVAPALTTAAFGQIYGEHEAQDTRLMDAFTELACITEAPDAGAEPSPKNQTTKPTES